MKKTKAYCKVLGKLEDKKIITECVFDNDIEGLHERSFDLDVFDEEPKFNDIFTIEIKLYKNDAEAIKVFKYLEAKYENYSFDSLIGFENDVD